MSDLEMEPKPWQKHIRPQGNSELLDDYINYLRVVLDSGSLVGYPCVCDISVQEHVAEYLEDLLVGFYKAPDVYEEVVSDARKDHVDPKYWFVCLN